MDFFEQQARARRDSRVLLLFYAAALAAVVASFNVAAALVYGVLALFGAAPLAGGEAVVWTGLIPTYAHAVLRVPPAVHLWVSAVAAAVVLGVTMKRLWQLREGGSTVAWMLGARYLERGRATPTEARLLNVVDEMAIASGIAVPPVYLLDEDSINALVAGHTPSEAVIIVTRGAMVKLSRDELQGVMGHEFSHILNGDMALNIRLTALLAGVACFGEWGESLVYDAAATSRRLAREDRGSEVLSAIAGAAMAFIGFPGTVAAEAIKAAISRQRELLADAASVQFTRNPDGIAGALDSIGVLRTGTSVHAAHAASLSHMFFAPAIARWWAFPTHPPVEERIRRAHPRFQREEYRRNRHAATREDGRVAVLDGQGNIVKVLGGIASAAALVEPPRAAHVDHARALLATFPAALRKRLATPEGAAQVMLALLLEREGPARTRQLELLGVEAEGVLAARFELQDLGRRQFMLLAELALPALKEWPQEKRDAFDASVIAMVEADGKVTLGEFVQATLLRQHLREGAGKPIPTKFGKVAEVATEANIVISLIAHASRGDTALSHAKGWPLLGLPEAAPLPVDGLTTARVGEALERLRHLQPFEKPRLLKACVETAAADGAFRLAEMELVRAVAATLDCPIPPAVRALDPAALA